MSIRARIALFGLGVVTVVLAAFCMLVFLLLAAGVPKTQDDALAARAAQATDGLQLPAAPQPVPPGATDPGVSGEIYVVLLDREGALLAGTGLPPRLDGDVLARAARDGSATATVDVIGRAGERVRVHVRPFGDGYVVAVQTMRKLREDRQGIFALVVVYALLAFGVATAGIWVVAGRALRPLRSLAALTDEIGRSGDLGRRLPAVRGRDVQAKLTGSFNAMLDRLQSAFAAQRRFTADASHELRTPLTSVRHNAGFLLAHPDAADPDREAAVRDIAAESERMSRLVDNLLALARADAGQPLTLAPVDLAALAEDVCRRAGDVYAEREISCSATPVPPVSGDADALTQLLWILVENAAKHGSHVWVAVTQRGPVAQVHVSDDGPGLPPGAEKLIFERFWRGDEARTGRGAGLGLAIAATIVRAHRGTILAANNGKGGASFVAELPLAG
jgi:two-component system, OmpR family, sensor kinase